MNENIGYVAIEFDDYHQQQVINWSRQIKTDDLVTANINGKIKGGNVTEKLHLTLFYGLDEDRMDQVALTNLIKQLNILSVDVVDIGMFPAKEFDCSVLHFCVADGSGELQLAFEQFKELPHFDNHQNLNFRPHITIAYVTKNFNSTILSNEYPKKLKVKQVTHFQKTKEIS